MDSVTSDEEFVLVFNEKTGKSVELPIEEDSGCISLATLRSTFPHATGLSYSKRKMASVSRAVRLDNAGNFHPPKSGWGSRKYSVIVESGEASDKPQNDGASAKNTKATSEDEWEDVDDEDSPSRSKKTKRSFFWERKGNWSKEKKTSTKESNQAKGHTGSGNSKASESGTLREEGNEIYRSAFGFSIGSCEVTKRLMKAADMFREARDCAKVEDDMSSAVKNLGLTCWKLAVHYHKHKAVHYSTTSGLFNEAFLCLCSAAEMGERVKDQPWIQRVKTNLDEAIDSFFEFIMEEFRDYEGRAKFLHCAVDQVSLDVYQGKIHYELASTYFKWALVEISDGDACGFAKALKILGDCYYPIEEAKRLTGMHPLWPLRDSLTDLEDDVFLNKCFAESLQAMHQADLLIEEIVCEEEELNMDGVHRVMDMYKEAIVLTRGKAVEYEAMAHSKLGWVYKDVLKLKQRAKDYFMHCLHLAESLMPRNFAGEDWFDDATEAIREMQDEEKRKEDEKWQKERDPFLKQLNKEMETLKEIDQKSAEQILLSLPEKFPAKHRTKKEKDEDKKSLDDLKNLERGEIKKLIQKMILMYHPDHVDKEKFGKKYYVLCEEITKVLTGKYETFKR